MVNLCFLTPCNYVLNCCYFIIVFCSPSHLVYRGREINEIFQKQWGNSKILISWIEFIVEGNERSIITTYLSKIVKEKIHHSFSLVMTLHKSWRSINMLLFLIFTLLSSTRKGGGQALEIFHVFMEFCCFETDLFSQIMKGQRGLEKLVIFCRRHKWMTPTLNFRYINFKFCRTEKYFITVLLLR